MRRVIVLRPEPGASDTMARARKLGLHAVSIPLFAVEPIAWEAPNASAFDGVLLTSANAIRHGGRHLASLRGLKAYAVGSATAHAARAAGFEVAATGDGSVETLLGSLDPGLRLLHLCGDHRAAAASAVTPIVVYRSRPVERPPVHDVSDSVVLVHSPRAGRRLAELVESRGSIAIAAISKAAADAAGSGWAEIAIADQPSDEALLALAARLCNTPHPQ